MGMGKGAGLAGGHRCEGGGGGGARGRRAEREPAAPCDSSSRALASSEGATFSSTSSLFYLLTLLPSPLIKRSLQEVEARITKVIEEYKQTLIERTELHMG